MAGDQDNGELIGLIRDSAISYLASENTLARARRQNEGIGADTGGWPGLGAVGWTGMLVAEATGSGGLGLAEAVALHEELGRGLLPEPLALAAHLPALALNRCEGAVAARLLGEIATGEAPVPVVWQSMPGQLSCEDTALRVEVGRRLSGTARFVVGFAGARQMLVAARGAEGVGVYRVDAAAPGLKAASERLADGSGVATLVFEGVDVGPSDIIAKAGARALDAALDEARLIIAAEMLGLMREVLARTLDYMRTRKQFGRAIGSFQALQHRAVDLHAQVELTAAAVARSVEQMAGAMDDGVRAAAASAAKARASEAALIVTREAVQLHGAIAYTQEHDIGLFLNRALVLSTLLGNGAAHRRRYGRLVSQTLVA